MDSSARVWNSWRLVAIEQHMGSETRIPGASETEVREEHGNEQRDAGGGVLGTGLAVCISSTLNPNRKKSNCSLQGGVRGIASHGLTRENDALQECVTCSQGNQSCAR